MLRPTTCLLAGALLAAGGCRAATPGSTALANVADPPGRAVWIYRELSTGAALRSSSLATYRLVIDGDQATLAVTRAETTEGRTVETTRLTGWQDRAARTFAGTATVDGPRLVLELHEAGAPVVWRWRCALEPVEVAPADAVRVPSADAGECGDEGEWSRPTAATPALTCAAVADAGDQVYGEFAFGPEPGLENLHINDDCFQGGGLRRIAPDGAVAAIRGG